MRNACKSTVCLWQLLKGKLNSSGVAKPFDRKHIGRGTSGSASKMLIELKYIGTNRAESNKCSRNRVCVYVYDREMKYHNVRCAHSTLRSNEAVLRD